MNRLVKEDLLDAHAKINLSICKHCLAGKIIKKSFDKAIRAESTL